VRTIDELGISPTPWSVNLKHPGYVLNADENVVVKGLSGMDARFIAAAPEMYEALEECERKLDAIEPFGNLLVKVRKTLTKASGGETE